jgi:hypothetical protein
MSPSFPELCILRLCGRAYERTASSLKMMLAWGCAARILRLEDAVARFPVADQSPDRNTDDMITGASHGKCSHARPRKPYPKRTWKFLARMRYAGLGYVGRTATRLATLFAGPYGSS